MRAAIIIALCAVNALAGSTGVVWRGASSITDFRETIEPSLYESAVLWMPMNANPASYATWRVEDGSAARNNGAQATTNSRPLWQSGPTNGNGCLLFDGTDDHVRVPVPQMDTLGTNDFSLMAWVRIIGNNSTAESIMGKRSTPGLNQFQLRIGVSAGGLDFITYDSSDSRLYSAGTSYNDGRWRHIACVRAGPILRIYVDGTNTDTSGALTVRDINNTNDFLIGARSPDGANAVNIAIDDVGLFTRAISSNEIHNAAARGRASHPL